MALHRYVEHRKSIAICNECFLVGNSIFIIIHFSANSS